MMNVTRETASRGLLAAFIGLVVIEIARAAADQSKWNWPEPRRVVAPAVVYTALSLVAAASPELALAMAVGIDLAVALNPNIGNKVQGVVSSALGGKTASVPPQTVGSDAKSGYAPSQTVSGVTSNSTNTTGVRRPGQPY